MSFFKIKIIFKIHPSLQRETKKNLPANFRNLQHCHYWSYLSFHHRHDYKSSNDNLFLDSRRDVEVSQLQWQSWKFSTNLPFVHVSGPLQGVCKFPLILTPASGRFARHNQSFPPTQFELKEQLDYFTYQYIHVNCKVTRPRKIRHNSKWYTGCLQISTNLDPCLRPVCQA